MPDYSFIKNVFANQWIVSAPRRAKRPDIASGQVPPCPFCPGKERDEKEIYRLGGNEGDSNWEVRVLANKFPFAPAHEVIVHSQDHHKNIDELPLGNVQKLFQVYRDRFNTLKNEGNVVIFQNHGQEGGESLQHPHSQLVVIPKHVTLDVPSLPSLDGPTKETEHFYIFCPLVSQWPDEVWVVPNEQHGSFGDATVEELHDLSYVMQRLISILDLRHGQEFPFNYYISPWNNWYIRIIPRQKRLGGFELATNVYVNTQDPKETITFIQEHFDSPDREKILHEHQALYHRGV
ncbi:MAG: hypothetical protein KGJ07_01055 [Patescibacteria group bacterium]|nr:hypothetical protein [Patescibacteria group bacterium]MDE2589646.1 hypothetical protein [Patescibacteria group bacterium]